MKKKEKTASPSLADDVFSFVRSQGMNRDVAYVERGRIFKTLADEELKDKWREGWKALGAEPSDEGLFNLANDLESEMTVRGFKAPYEDIMPEFECWMARVQKGVREAEKDPERRSAANESLEKKLDEYRKAREKKN